MADAIEIIDDFTELVDGVITQFTVTLPPYLPGSVHLYIDGLLCPDDTFTETDPVAGVVTLAAPPRVYTHPIDKTSVHIVYNTFNDPDPPIVIHITELTPKDFVRIAMKPGRHLIPKRLPNGTNTLIADTRNRAARGSHRTTIIGRVNQNLPTQGYMTVQTSKARTKEHFLATVQYADIQSIQRYISARSPALGVETAPKSLPGVKALGTYKLNKGLLIRVNI